MEYQVPGISVYPLKCLSKIRTTLFLSHRSVSLDARRQSFRNIYIYLRDRELVIQKPLAQLFPACFQNNFCLFKVGKENIKINRPFKK